MKVFLGEIEKSEPVLIHEFDDAADFLEVHGGKKVGGLKDERRCCGTRCASRS
jgi:hypothetical protein